MKERTRLAVQGVAALLQNANFRGFFTGTIYQGPVKRVCVPGLNCYSCPGAVGSCPIGSLQNALSATRFRLPYYILGLLLFFGALLGRAICGFLCPFGLLQDLLYKIPFPKKIRSFRGDRLLRKLKYPVLLLMVIALPLMIRLTPVFCKYLCPSGTLSGILLALGDPNLFAAMGWRFAWKLCVLVAVCSLSVVICRPFCRYLCPLGAIYAPMNRVSLLRLELDRAACVHCGKCAAVCPMAVDPAAQPNHLECIRCGKCIGSCPTRALHYGCAVSARPASTEEP